MCKMTMRPFFIFLRVIGSLLVGYWLPIELFLFGKKRKNLIIANPAKRILTVFSLTLLCVSIKLFALIWWSYDGTSSLSSFLNYNGYTAAYVLIGYACIVFCLIQTVVYIFHRQYTACLLCGVPWLFSLFIVVLFTHPKPSRIINHPVAVLHYQENEEAWNASISKIASSTTKPVFIILEKTIWSDTVTRFVVYDETDEIARPRALNIEFWRRASKEGTVVFMSRLDAEHISGHFYVVYADNSEGLMKGYNFKNKGDSYEILQGTCSKLEVPVHETCSDQWGK